MTEPSSYKRIAAGLMGFKSTVSLLAISCLSILFLGCDTNGSHEELIPLEGADLSDVRYGMTVFNSQDDVVLLGQLLFSVNGDQITGSWNIETWGEHPEFSTLPVNDGGQFPTADFQGTLSGTLFGETAIIRIDLPGTDTFLGLSIEGSRAGRLVGRASLLPEQIFDGRFEAIRQ